MTLSYLFTFTNGGQKNCSFTVTATQGATTVSTNSDVKTIVNGLDSQFKVSLDSKDAAKFNPKGGPITITATVSCGGLSSTTTASPKELLSNKVHLTKITGVIDPASSPGTVVGGINDADNVAVAGASIAPLSHPSNSVLSDSQALFSLGGLKVGATETQVASMPGFLTTLRTLQTCENGNATLVNLVSLADRDLLSPAVTSAGHSQDPALGVVAGQVQYTSGNAVGRPNSLVRITPSTGNETILYFDPATASFSSTTAVLPGSVYDAGFIILNVDPARGPFTIAAFDAATGREISHADNVVVSPSQADSPDSGVWTPVVIGPPDCP